MYSALASEERFKKLPIVKKFNEFLRVGNGVKKLLLKYFSKQLLKGGSSHAYKNIPYDDYYRWQAQTDEDPESYEAWRNELMENHKNYFTEEDDTFLRIGLPLLRDAIDGLAEFDKSSHREILGGSSEQFRMGVDNIMKIRDFGEKATKLGWKVWKKTLGTDPQEVFRRRQAENRPEEPPSREPSPVPPEAEAVALALARRLERIKEIETQLRLNAEYLEIESIQPEDLLEQDRARGEYLQSEGYPLSRDDVGRLEAELAELKQLSGMGIKYIDYYRWLKARPKERTSTDNIIADWTNEIVDNYKNYFNKKERFAIFLGRRLMTHLRAQRLRLRNQL